MAFVGLVLLIVAVVLFFNYQGQKNKLTNLLSAEAVTIENIKATAAAISDSIGVGSCREYVKVKGVIQCETPLLSELKQEPCVHYEMNVTREYEETVTRTDSEGETHRETERRSETISSNQRSIHFQLQDNTGIIEVNPEEANMETISILNEFRPGSSRGGLISFGNFSFALGSSFGDTNTLGYRYQESILPVGRQVFILATASDESGTLTLEKPLNHHQTFLISLKNEENLVQSAKSAQVYLLWGTVASVIIGAILILLGR
ncbi:MAG: E3 ubiquitin ligase family protein [Cyanobacteria bacterium LVE1205-1]|jgi:hypothetical protein